MAFKLSHDEIIERLNCVKENIDTQTRGISDRPLDYETMQAISKRAYTIIKIEELIKLLEEINHE